MLKYYDYEITCLEVPGEISLAFSISGCQIKCKGCHSQHLWLDTGTEMTFESVNRLIETNKHISCVLFLGGEHEVPTLLSIQYHLKQTYPDIKIAWYTGFDYDVLDIDKYNGLQYIDYIKFGRYIEELGGLASEKTNQKLFKKEMTEWIDISHEFRKLNE